MMRAKHKPKTYELFVGVDIAAESARVALLKQDGAAEAEFSIAQTTSGMTELKQALLATKWKAGAVLVVMEATGSYWMRLAMALYEADFAVSILNPLQACHFAQTLLKRANASNCRVLLIDTDSQGLRRWSRPGERTTARTTASTRC